MKSTPCVDYPVAQASDRLEGPGSPEGLSGACINCDSELHKMHICYLRSQGLERRIESISDHPTVECGQCGAKANSAENVCAAHLGGDAPNVEGGHGSIVLDQIGKPHGDW